MTISDQASGFRVWNNTGEIYDFIVDGDCKDNVGIGAEITEPAKNHLLNPGETINRYAKVPGGCPPGILATLTYDQAVAADNNCNCEVNFTGTDR